jgi:hypothetical protein
VWLLTERRTEALGSLVAQDVAGDDEDRQRQRRSRTTAICDCDRARLHLRPPEEGVGHGGARGQDQQARGPPETVESMAGQRPLRSGAREQRERECASEGREGRMVEEDQGRWMALALILPLVGGVGGCRRVVASPARRAAAIGTVTPRWRERELGQLGWLRGTVHLGPVHSASFLFIFCFLFSFVFFSVLVIVRAHVHFCKI